MSDEAEDTPAVDRRFPRSVYRVGTEPDPRFSLANERTMLAWIRTSLALLAVGVAIETLAVGSHSVLRAVSASVFIALSAGSAVYAWVSWMRAEKALRAGRALPGPSLAAAVSTGVVVAIVVLALALLV